MSKGNVLSLFDYTGNIARPWAEAGYDCYCIDIKHADEGSEYFPSGGNLLFIHEDVMNVHVTPTSVTPTTGYDIVFAAPPCTDLAVSGARWFKSKGMQKLIEALTLVERARIICEASGAPYMIENPVSTLATYWRKPDYTFDPCQYGGYLPNERCPENCQGQATCDIAYVTCRTCGGSGYIEADAYTKKTCLWTGGGFIMPEMKGVAPVLGSKMHKLGPTEDRAELRSATPMGFSRAVFEANRKDKDVISKAA